MPAARGKMLAGKLGCFGCHGPAGLGGVANPGSDEEEIPSWDGGTPMMYVENEEESRERILYGKPKRMGGASPPGKDGHTHGFNLSAGQPVPPIGMPAYEHLLTEQDLEDLVAYFKTVAAYHTPPSEDAKTGYQTASRLGCFGCHGPGGRVGVANPGSFKGYIPAWLGDDFKELVRNEQELREWITHGRIQRLESNMAARQFTRRQIIQMPAYKSVMQPGELDALVAYIDWVARVEGD